MANAQPEATFRSYTAEEGRMYASGRTTYPPALYEVILNHHASTGGRFTSLLDCGCGPGLATRDLAPMFTNVVGINASTGMIASARHLGGSTKSGADIRYEISQAEALSEIVGLGEESVDMLTVASAAHWFDMPKFWAEAARVLVPGGTVAIWTRGDVYCHPNTPNAEKVRAVLHKFTNEQIAPFLLHGNHLELNLYDDLPLPWDVSPPVLEFPKSQYIKHEYDRDGVRSNGETFFGGDVPVSLEQLESAVDTASPVKRWRVAHPGLAGTGMDVVKVLFRELRDTIGEQEKVIQGSATAVLLLKKAAILSEGGRGGV